MGKLSRLRLKHPSKDKQSNEGVGAAELAVLSGGLLPGNGKDGGAQVEGKVVSSVPPILDRQRKAGE
jgi:hypothetical protein